MEQNTTTCMSVEEMGKRLGVSRVLAYRLANSEGFPAVRISPRRIVIPVAAFEKWLTEHTGAGNVLPE